MTQKARNDFFRVFPCFSVAKSDNTVFYAVLFPISYLSLYFIHLFYFNGLTYDKFI